MTKSSEQNSRINCLQTPQGGVGGFAGTPCFPPHTAIALKFFWPSQIALVNAARSAHIVGVKEAFSMFEPV